MTTGILLLTLALSAPPSFEIQTLDGAPLSGSIVSLSPERLVVDVGGHETTIPCEQLLSVSVGKKQNPAKRLSKMLTIVLTDGSTLVAKQYNTSGTEATITLADGRTSTCPTAAVHSVRLQNDSNAFDAEWARLCEQNTQGDLLIIRKDDALDFHEGVLHDVSDEAVRFELEGEVLPVKRTKIFGIVYHHADTSPLPPGVCRITDASGSSWIAQSVEIAEEVTWNTPTGIHVAMPIDRMEQLDFSSGKIRYLSDIKPDSVQWSPMFATDKPIPALERFYRPRFDKNHESGPLRLLGVHYAKGISICSRTELTYRIANENFRYLQAMLGIDDAVRPQGKVRLIIRGDDKTLFDSIITGSDAPQSLNIDIAGIRRLTFLVDFAEGLSMGNHLLLCNARLTR